MYNNYLKLPFNNNKGELLLKTKICKTKSMTIEAEVGYELLLYAPRDLGAIDVTLKIYKDGNKKPEYISEFWWNSQEKNNDIYITTIKSDSLSSGLYFMEISVKTVFGSYYVDRYMGDVYFVPESSIAPSIQLTVSDFKYQKPEEIYGGIIYHVFVDRFCKGKGAIKKKGNEIIEGEWEAIPEYPEYPGAPLKNNTFYGGNLDGVKERLPYLSSLGVNVIYLSPIFDSPSNHKYDTADYMTVDQCFGGDKALKSLIDAAYKQGIRIILDGVFNHTGDDSIYFNRYGNYDSVGAYQSKNSPFYAWYDFKNYPEEYTCWWGIKILPRIHPDRPECGNYFLKAGGVLDKYRKMGIYGMRLDVADELSDGFISAIKKRLSSDGESYLLGEVWEDGSNKISYDVRKSYYQGSELDGVMNYPLRIGLIDYFVNKSTDKLRYALTDIILNAPKRIRNSQMNLLGTHDTERILTLLSGVDRAGKTNRELSKMRLTDKERSLASKRLLSAYAALATLPGIPSIYYGDEAGLEGFSDPFNRMPYPYGKENAEILDFYKKIGIIRRENSVYKEGEFELLLLDGDCFMFSRKSGGRAFVTIINNSKDDIMIESDDKLNSLIKRKASKIIIVDGESPEIFSVRDGARLKIHRG